MSEISQISKYYKSFSGTDTLAFIMMPGCSPVVIGSLTTISYSMFRNKKPVINIGRTNINGVTRGSRIFAGTMIFTLINQHWIKEIQEQVDYIKDFKTLKVDELPLFDIMIISANEYGNAVSMYIYGIDFTDEAQTISVEDLFTENTFSFVAREVSNFHKINYGIISGKNQKPKHEFNRIIQKYYVLDSSKITLDELGNLEKEKTLMKITEQHKEKVFELKRTLYYSSVKLMMGNDVAEIQELLSRIYDNVTVNGIFDSAMDTIVRKYQSDTKQDINGIVDGRIYTMLKNEKPLDGHRIGIVINRLGAFVYKSMSLNSDIVDTLPYNSHVELYKVEGSVENEHFQKWYKISTGYVVEEDIYSSYYTGSVIEFPILKFGDDSAYVMLIQNAINMIYPTFNPSGVMDKETEDIIKRIQGENGMFPSGIVDMNTWLLIESLSGGIISNVSNDNFTIKFSIAPGTYNITNKEILSEIPLFSTEVSCGNFINVKASVVCTYPNGKCETVSKMIQVKDLTKISLSDFRNAFVYNPKYGNIPCQVDYVVYAYNKKPYKWTILYS